MRLLALRSLRDHYVEVTNLLRSRFEEVVVDEARDCSNVDLAILQHLHAVGLPLVFVCDPDQAIYEFRGAQPDAVRGFGTTLGFQITLTGNWRSSFAICQVAATLRTAHGARPADDPIGEHHAEPAGVALLKVHNSRDLNNAVETFGSHSESLGIGSDDQLLLARAAGVLPKLCNGASQPPATPVSARVAWARAILSSPHHTARQRETAYDILKRSLAAELIGTTGNSLNRPAH